MKCTACGYDDIAQEPFKSEHLVIDGTGPKKQFIELHGATIGPWFTESSGKIVGVPVTIYACPNCGTVRMDNGC